MTRKISTNKDLLGKWENQAASPSKIWASERASRFELPKERNIIGNNIGKRMVQADQKNKDKINKTFMASQGKTSKWALLEESTL